jgi:hypothetical protein
VAFSWLLALAAATLIKALVDVGGMGWVAKDVDVVSSRVVQKTQGIVQSVSVNQECSRTSFHLLSSLCVELFNPQYANFAINPTFL